MITITQKMYENQKRYRDELVQAIEQKVKGHEFKKTSGAYGVYPQRGAGDYMMRPRIISGIVTLNQLRGISAIGKSYSKGWIHLTTRQAIQFHKIRLDDTWEIMKRLLDLDIVTYGTGGNSIRNITCPALSGVNPREVFDVTPHAIEATKFIFELDETITLPRKFKIGFSNTEEDEGLATIADLGFIAKMKNGRRGFVIYGGGGFGSNPEVSVKLSDWIDETQILYPILAMKQLFETHGNRENRNIARIRYILKNLGEEKFRVLYERHLKTVSVNDLHKIEHLEDVKDFSKQVEEPMHGLPNTISRIRQKQRGLYSLYLHPSHGDLSCEQLDQLLDMTEVFGDRVEYRLSITQGLYVRNLREEQIVVLEKTFKDLIPSTRLEASIACTGANNCSIGLMDGQNLLTNLHTYFDKKETLPFIRISGCRNSCALHQLAPIGLEGTKLKKENKTYPAYKVYIGGRIKREGTLIGTHLATIAEKNIVNMFKELYILSNQKDCQDWDTLYSKYKEDIEKIIIGYGGNVNDA
jgi:sulfite reductase (ferredoxin)